MINLEKTLMGGQTFSWVPENGGYTGVVSGRVYHIETEDDIAKNGLSDYFDCTYPYREALEYLSSLSPVLEQVIRHDSEIRILRQDPWETTVSFIISQNNNIKRIRKLCALLCRSFGDRIEGEFYSFPSPDVLKSVSEEQLRSLGLGYRAPYLLAAAKSDFSGIENLSDDEARAKLMEVKGIGVKVADCILLFGYHRMHSFPQDVWIRKVMSRYFPGSSGTVFHPYEALAQQYLFHASQSGLIKC